jgi:UDP-N-acetylglucosamine 1-carboxyvinyltransferase
MGHSHSAVIKGPTALRGAEISVPDLRAGFTYLIAAVCAEGRSVIRGVEELDRGYEDIDKSLRELGAQIERKQD